MDSSLKEFESIFEEETLVSKTSPQLCSSDLEFLDSERQDTVVDLQFSHVPDSDPDNFCSDLLSLDSAVLNPASNLQLPEVTATSLGLPFTDVMFLGSEEVGFVSELPVGLEQRNFIDNIITIYCPAYAALKKEKCASCQPVDAGLCEAMTYTLRSPGMWFKNAC